MPNSPQQSYSELFIISQLASIKRGQEVAQGTRERQLVMTGQVLEVAKLILTHVAAQKPSPARKSGHLWGRLKVLNERFELVHKLYRALVWSRVVFWPAYAYGGLRWLGWL